AGPACRPSFVRFLPAEPLYWIGASSHSAHLCNSGADGLGVRRPAPSRWATIAMTWADSFLRTLKENDVRLVTYVPDNVLTPLINGAAADNYFMSIGATREDEAVRTLSGG